MHVTFELLNNQRPAARHRGIVISAVLFLLTCALGLQMAVSRSTSLLGGQIRPRGWGMMFRPPSGFLSGEPVVTALGRAIPFYSAPDGEPVAELIIWRTVSEDNRSPAELCERVLKVLRAQSSWPLTRSSSRPTQKVTQRSIGSYAAYEVHDLRSGTIVRAATVGPSVAVCVSLRVAQPPITSELLVVFDRVSDSFVFDHD